MGSLIEINDTLKISKERGFPENLCLDFHVSNPSSSELFLGATFDFWNNDERLYNRPPTRVQLVEETPDGKWLYWGHAMVLEQTITKGKTGGKYRITRIHTPEYQRIKTDEESPYGKSYFGGSPKGFVLFE